MFESFESFGSFESFEPFESYESIYNPVRSHAPVRPARQARDHAVTGFLFNPLTFGSVWYAHVTYIALFLVAAVALYAFKTALGGRRVFEFTDA